MRISFIFCLLIQLNAFNQEVFEYGDKFGVKYNERLIHSAVYEEVNIKDYFVFGKKEQRFYNLSQSGKYSTIPYRKFKFHLLDQLLVLGVREDYTLDLYDETGEFIYAQNAPYRNLRSIFGYADQFREDLLIAKKVGGIGVYDWVNKKEIVEPVYDDLKIHNSCAGNRLLIFARKGAQNEVLNDEGKRVLSFRAGNVDDIYPANNCVGFILRRGYKIGYMVRKSSGKFFLIRPKFDDVLFPSDNSKIILTKKEDEYGLYYNYREILKCKYSNIEIIDRNYVLAIVTHNGLKYSVNHSGKMTHSQR